MVCCKKSKRTLQAMPHTLSFYTFNIYGDVTEAGVIVCCSSAAVDGSVDCTVILRGGENTVIASLWRSSCGVKSWHQFRGTRWSDTSPFNCYWQRFSIDLSCGSTVD